VGLAGNLKWRLRQHLKDHHGQSWDRFSVYFTIGDAHLKELETLILRITGKPRGNKNKGKFKDSENLKRTLKRDVKNYQRRELLDLIGQDFKTDLVKISDKRKEGRQPILAAYIRAPLKLRASVRGKKFKARVRRDGSIRFRKRTYNSPSAAGSAVCKHACDGWHFWKYERAPGDWVKLNELRK
jgi:Restriction Enzyme Adenine Methylase Associated